MGTAAKRKPATLDDLARARDEGLAVELIDGELVEKAAPTPAHGMVHAKVPALLDRFNRRGNGEPGGWWLMIEVEVLYPLTGEVFRHDAVGFRRDRLAARPNEMPVRARPDWACEILSPSTARYDVAKKQATLHRHEVPHYWLIDPTNDTLTVMRWQSEHYLRVLDAGPGDVVRAEPFDPIEIQVAELLGHDV